MFSKFSNQPTPDAVEDLEAVLAAKELEFTKVDTETSSEDTELAMGHSPKIDHKYESSSVQMVEKISNILSPYFIVLVGLFLYDSNFLIGTTLIFIGIFSLLKLSWQDVQTLINKITAFFQAKP